jgi:hypothetical protein
MPVSVIEAQCVGIPCVLSDNITREVQVGNDVKYLPIDKNSLDKWCDLIIEMRKNNRNKKFVNIDIREAGFDIQFEAEKLQQKYLDLASM